MQQPVNALPANGLDLKDIHVPEQIANYPIAYGWWLLAALIIFIIIVAIIKVRKSIKRNRVKKQALAQFSLLENNSPISNSDIIALLKWAAMHYFSRAELAKTFGESLQAFFTSKLPTKHQQNFADLSEQAFKNQYQAQLELAQDTNKPSQVDNKFLQAAKLWLTHALPPKPLKAAKKVESTDTFKSENASQGVKL